MPTDLTDADRRPPPTVSERPVFVRHRPLFLDRSTDTPDPRTRPSSRRFLPFAHPPRASASRACESGPHSRSLSLSLSETRQGPPARGSSCHGLWMILHSHRPHPH
mmetsp:Transcript_8434/g.26277  ORF Transcript_8434/g.26277 Transcript_8434/m.26277 type:complete len:106 (-) Transcript_8434:35-352(-)